MALEGQILSSIITNYHHLNDMNPVHEISASFVIFLASQRISIITNGTHYDSCSDQFQLPLHNLNSINKLERFTVVMF
uniref:Uncharacterized protein n=1 Tax=Tetranychus urticae TaxID=32264 RepID=T1JUH7_TETUR